VDPATLPTRALEDGGDGTLQPLVGIGHHQPHAAQPTADREAQERRPEGAVLARPDIEPEPLALFRSPFQPRFQLGDLYL
jgi:hypothetical protein